MPYIDTGHLFKCETCRFCRHGKCNTFCDAGESYSPNLAKIPTADVVPRDEAEMHGQSYYYKLEQAIESSKRFMAEHDAALAKKIFEEIESVLFTVANPCPSADGTIIVKHSKDFHIRREDYYTIKEKYTKGGGQE